MVFNFDFVSGFCSIILHKLVYLVSGFAQLKKTQLSSLAGFLSGHMRCMVKWKPMSS